MIDEEKTTVETMEDCFREQALEVLRFYAFTHDYKKPEAEDLIADGNEWRAVLWPLTHLHGTTKLFLVGDVRVVVTKTGVTGDALNDSVSFLVLEDGYRVFLVAEQAVVDALEQYATSHGYGFKRDGVFHDAGNCWGVHALTETAGIRQLVSVYAKVDHIMDGPVTLDVTEDARRVDLDGPPKPYRDIKKPQ